MKTYLIDLDGTMYRGNSNIDGAKQFIDNCIENKIQRGKLKISKEVQGNKDYAGEFEFKVTLTYKTTTLTGKYNYKIFKNNV